MTNESTTTGSAPVVVGCDGSDAGKPALDYAFREAARRGTRVHVVMVFTLPATAYGYGMVMPDLSEVEQALRAEAERTARDTVDAVRGSLEPDAGSAPFEITVHEGRPAAVLLAASHGAALLVVGARGLGAWGRLLLGSTSTEVIHHAHIPVVVVPSPEPAPDNAPGPRAEAVRL